MSRLQKRETEMCVQFLMWAHDVPIFRFDLYHPRSIFWFFFSFRLPAKFLLIFDFDGFSYIFLMKSLFNWRSSDFYLFILRMSIITSTWWMCDGPGYQMRSGNVNLKANWWRNIVGDGEFIEICNFVGVSNALKRLISCKEALKWIESEVWRKSWF